MRKRLIHRTKRGDLVRSKSEVIIANELYAQGVNHYELRGTTFSAKWNDAVSGFLRLWMTTQARFIIGSTLGCYTILITRLAGKKKLKAYREARIYPYDEEGGEAGTLIYTRDDKTWVELTR